MTESESPTFDPQDHLYQMFLDANQSSESSQGNEFVDKVMMEFDIRKERRTKAIIACVRYIRVAALVLAIALLPYLAQAIQGLPSAIAAPSETRVSLFAISAMGLIFATSLIWLAFIPLLTRRT